MIPLPLDDVLSDCLAGLESGALVLSAPPGSGKTTRLPAAIVESGILSEAQPGVVVLQPRRIAARASAARVAEERGWTLGDRVGYQVRDDRRISSATRLQFVTEGILNRRLLSDPFLEGIGAVVLDEFHERNLDSDLALALLREVRDEVRPDLKLVVMSATLDAGPVSEFLGGAPIVTAGGRVYPVEIEYAPADRPASPEAIAPIVGRWLDDPRSEGHLLVFLPGMAEIRRAAARLGPIAERAGAVIRPLHGSLSPDDQDRALRPEERRKVILSTNVAETSLTIEGVRTVIDSGLARSVRYDPARGVDRWTLERISRASADQRAGRAGRTAPGRCIRLWPEREDRGRRAFEEPDIRRVDLASALLTLHSWGQSDPSRFQWFEAPDPERLEAAERVLSAIGAISGVPARITAIGRKLLDLPVHPRLGRLLVAAGDAGRLDEGASVAALLSERDFLARDPAEKRPDVASGFSSTSDVLVRLDQLAEAEASRFSPSIRSRGIDPTAAHVVARLRDDLLRRFGRGARGRRSARPPDVASHDDAAIRRWLLLAYPDRVVKRRGAERTGLMVGGRGVRLAPSSVVREADYLLALDARDERRAGRREVQVFLASAIDPDWLEELHPASIRRERATVFDPQRRRAIGVARTWYLDLILREVPTSDLDRDEAARLLAGELRRQEIHPALANEPAVEWLARLDLVRRGLPELDWPVFDEATLAEVAEEACRGKTSMEEVDRIDWIPHLESRLDRRQSIELREGAPESLLIPSGRRVRLTYESGRPPVLAARIQELFGLAETPRVARGRLAVLLHILGPNHRPVQVTDDLPSFWKNTYFQVRKDLRGRYPKHPWPDDPLNAPPIAAQRRKPH